MSFYFQLKEFILGESLPTSVDEEERLGKATALAVLSGNALLVGCLYH